MKMLSFLKFIILSFLFFLPFTATEAAINASPLVQDKVFQLSVSAKDPQTVQAHWKIKPGYYLYRDRLHFTAIPPESAQLSAPIYPPGNMKTFHFLGKMVVYHDQVTVTIPVLSATHPHFDLKISYQGCSEQGYCYPPNEKIIPVHLAGIENPTLGKSEIDQHKVWIILSFVGFGILVSLTPCVLPMIPILSAIILGQRSLRLPHAFALSSTYVLAMAFTYALIGIVFGWIGSSLQSMMQQPWAIGLLGLIIAVMAFSLFDFYHIQLPEKWRSRLKAINHYPSKGGYLQTAIMGCLSVLILSPCVTPPLVIAISYIGHTGNALLGGIFLFAMGLGMGLPLLLIGTLGSQLIPKSGPWMNTVKHFLGFLLLGMAIWILNRILPETVVFLLFAILIASAGLYLGALSSPKQSWQWLTKGLGLGLLIYSIVLAVGIWPENQFSSQQQKYIPQFITVKTLSDVQQQIVAAKGKPVLLDFYADWCAACREIDHSIFHNPQMQKQLSGYVLLRANVTANDLQDKILQQRWGVIGPPTILVFNSAPSPTLAPSERIVGNLSAKTFAQYLARLNPATDVKNPKCVEKVTC